MAEIQITINEKGIVIRYATGLEVKEVPTPLEQVLELTEDRVRNVLNKNSNEYLRAEGFQIAEGPTLLFWRNPAKEKGFWLWRKQAEARLTVLLGPFIDIIGTTGLYDEIQIANGNFEFIVRQAIKRAGPYPFPRLKYGGLHEPKAD